MSAKRLLIVLPRLKMGGSEKAVCRLVRALDRQIIEPVVAVFGVGGECQELLPPDVSVRVLEHRRGWRRALMIRDLARLVRREKIDLVYSVLDFPNQVALCAKAAGLLRAPLVIGVRSNYCYGLGPGVPWRRVKRLMVRALYPLADRVLCVTEEARQVLGREFGVPLDRCTTLGNIVPGADEVFANDAGDPGINAWLDGGTQLVLGVGRLDRVKQFDKLLRAFSVLRRERAAKLLILGDGPERERLSQLAKVLNLSQDCLLGGTVAEPMQYMLRADCLAVTSRSEGFPNVVAEAIGCGLPVIAFDHCASVVQMLSGWPRNRVVPHDDLEGLAGALRDTLDQRLDARKAGRSATVPALNPVSTPVAAYEEVFLSLCASFSRGKEGKLQEVAP